MSTYIIKAKRLILFRRVTFVNSEDRKKCTNTLREKCKVSFILKLTACIYLLF